MRVLMAVLGSCVLLSTSCVASDAAGPPGPPASLPPPPGAYSLPDGQWVQTQRYGWVWMPYGDAYAFVPPDGSGEPLEYLYHPSVGWSWFAAPWIWGAGPMPSFRRHDADRFAWYQHGYWRTPERWRYRPAPARPGYAARGVRPAPARTAPQARRPAEGERRGGESVAAPARPAPREGDRGRGEDRGDDRRARGDREGR